MTRGPAIVVGRVLLYCLAAAATVLLASCSRRDPRPSILLFVFDTTRADAVSAYGRVHDTTPEFDALAASGLRYAHAYANAPWTLPSHVTLFTGLLVHQHGVGSRGVRAPDALLMLAERLRAVGYETVGVSENPFVSPTFNLAQGFERFVNKRRDDAAPGAAHGQPGGDDVPAFVAEWLRTRRGQRPFFLFVNVMDAHELYPIHTENRFVPEGVDAGALQALDRHVNQRICAALPSPREIDILKGLYLGGVAAADAKLRNVRAALRDAGVGAPLITIVTADHGEHFGEHRLMEHNFSVREALMHVPLVVSGVPGVRPAVLEQPVQLADITPTVLRWAGVEVPNDLPGRPLPTTPAEPLAAAAIVAEYTEPNEIVETGDEPDWLKKAHAQVDVIRSACAAEDRVFGSMLALVHYPFKLIWFQRYPAALYNLAADPEEAADLAAARPDIVATFRPELDALLASAASARPPAAPAAVPQEVQEQLHALGYLGGANAPNATPTANRSP
jgi:arylsulfatase A-like enzyme